MQKPESSPTAPIDQADDEAGKDDDVGGGVHGSLLSRRPQDHAIARRTGNRDESCLGIFQRIDRRSA